MSYWSRPAIHVEFNTKKFTYLLENHSIKTKEIQKMREKEEACLIGIFIFNVLQQHNVICNLYMRLFYNYNSNSFDYKFDKYEEMYMDIDPDDKKYLPQIHENILENEDLFKVKITNAISNTLLEGDYEIVYKMIVENMLTP